MAVKKLGSNAVEYMAKLGIEELRAANSGQPIKAPEIQPAESPAVQKSSYVGMINRKSEQAESRSAASEGMSR